jgi:hypothetical protein
MKRLLLLSLIFIVSCTGTPEDEPPVYVIAGVVNGTQAELVLFEDDYKNVSNTSPRFKLFDSEELEAPAVAFDIVDRINSRSELIVLTRETVDTSFLEFFSLRGVQEEADFVESDSKQIALSTLTDLPEDISLCPNSIQVTRDGALAALVNNPSLCRVSGSEISILLIDIKNKTFLNEITRNTFDVFPISPVATTIDQNNDTLYFLSTRATDVILNRLSRGQFNTDDLDRDVVSYSDEIDISNPSDFVKRSSDALILSRSQSIYTYASLSGDTLENTNIPTLNLGQSFIPDFTHQYHQVFLLNGQRLAIHQDPKATATPNRIEGSTPARLGTINTFTDFLYLAYDNTLQVFDLFELENSPGSIALETESESDNADLESLNDPTILTWVQGVITEDQ